MTTPSQAIFGRDIYQDMLQDYQQAKEKPRGGIFKKKFDGRIVDNTGRVMHFSKPALNVTLRVHYEVVSNATGPHVHITAADLELEKDVSWELDHFFFCEDPKDSSRYTLPHFPTVAALKSGWCADKMKSDEAHPEGRQWCATGAQGHDYTSIDYFLYGNPYPKPHEGCSIFKSVKLYSFHFKPSRDGIDVHADTAYNLRFHWMWWHHPENRKPSYDISDYFKGGLILGGAYGLFQKLLAKTSPKRDCSPAVEGLLGAMVPSAMSMVDKK